MQNHITQITPDSEMLAECISAICQNSLHTYEKDIANGFITLYGGHRAGLCGTAVYGNGGLQTFDKHKDSTSALRGGKGSAAAV